MSNLLKCHLCKDSSVGCTAECIKSKGVTYWETSKPKPEPMIGWVCPNCGAGMSPFTDRCGCKDTNQITC